METLVTWAAADGHRLEPYGLDVSAASARHRLPQWADHIWTGNAMTWRAPRTFDFVRPELVYAPPGRERDLVQRLLSHTVAPGGRLVLCSYGSARRAQPRVQPLGTILADWSFDAVGQAEAIAPNGLTITRVVWVDRAVD
jgi:hypothetical protein